MHFRKLSSKLFELASGFHRFFLWIEYCVAWLLSAAEIKELRLSLGYTQEDFTGLIGVDPKIVQRWEYGIQHPRDRYEHRMLQLAEYRRLQVIIECRMRQAIHFRAIYGDSEGSRAE